MLHECVPCAGGTTIWDKYGFLIWRTLSFVEQPLPVIPPSGEKHTAKHKFESKVRKRGMMASSWFVASNMSLLTFVVSDEAGPVAKVLVTFDNLLLSVIVTLQKWTWNVKKKSTKCKIAAIFRKGAIKVTATHFAFHFQFLFLIFLWLVCYIRFPNFLSHLVCWLRFIVSKAS